ncbi:MAG: GWxTD domain-containing protein, partial [Candidatus Eisenbacteria bacterium]|nr:GWxTD domain-containing protein [Candidatus Eisenbacteria bacterium]
MPDVDFLARLCAALLPSLIVACLAGCAANAPGLREMVRYERAKGLYEQKKYDEALKQIRPVQVHYPFWPEGCLLYARCARATGTIEGRRLASDALKKLIARNPGRADLKRELASLYFEQGFFDYAEDQYEDLLGMNEADANAHYMLGLVTERDWKRHHNLRDLARMISELSRAAQLDSSNTDALRLLALAYLEKEDKDSVQLVSSQLLARRPTDRDAVMLAAIARHVRGEYEAELGLWETFFSLSDSVGLAPYNDITPLLTPAQKRRLRRLDEAPKARFTRNFWKELDPTPTTELNERVLEHWYRVGLAHALYTDDKVRIPGWLSGRGQVLVRYGMPQSKEYTIALSDRDNVGLPALIWSYADEMGPFSVTFVDYTLSGNYTYMAFSKFASALDERLYYGPTSYSHDYNAEAYQNFFASAGFMRGAGVREEFYIGVPLEKVMKGDWRLVPVEFAVFDTLWNSVLRVSTALQVSGRFASDGTGAVLVTDLNFTLPPDEYIVAVAVRDTVSGTVGLTKERVTVPDLGKTRPDVSEIELAYVLPAGRRPPGISKPEGILANPSGVYVTPEPLRVYYEVYNLARGPDGKHSFTTKYSIVPHKKKGSLFWEFVGSLFTPGQHYVLSSVERQVERQSTSEELSIDISTLKDGTYRLVLEV